ncbi:uncharacterized protein BJ171DRAFT_297084 [Polychytrium aggregatum]|uniref:uncharacterized protein n=1 Tax=Polychytrium aggregatum TaxID=110093 RepID=UPI0022FDD585|nr:uncharacterized protein BJ171DRAFT_297084 [Polychytrium aggregatum]KAI9207402.1 hypothetical protein BJ171DRAFT_297084 [Polychytrium aggregatum]
MSRQLSEPEAHSPSPVQQDSLAVEGLPLRRMRSVSDTHLPSSFAYPVSPSRDQRSSQPSVHPYSPPQSPEALQQQHQQQQHPYQQQQQHSDPELYNSELNSSSSILLHDDFELLDFASMNSKDRIAWEKKNRELHRLFKSIDENDLYVDDFSCALQKDILIQGKLFITTSNLCFYANIIGFITTLVIPFADISSMEKKMAAFIVPNAILVKTRQTKYFFTTFISREKAFEIMVGVWKSQLGGALSHEHTSSGEGSQTIETDIVREIQSATHADPTSELLRQQQQQQLPLTASPTGVIPPSIRVSSVPPRPSDARSNSVPIASSAAAPLDDGDAGRNPQIERRSTTTSDKLVPGSVSSVEEVTDNEVEPGRKGGVRGALQSILRRRTTSNKTDGASSSNERSEKQANGTKSVASSSPRAILPILSSAERRMSSTPPAKNGAVVSSAVPELRPPAQTPTKPLAAEAPRIVLTSSQGAQSAAVPPSMERESSAASASASRPSAAPSRRLSSHSIGHDKTDPASDSKSGRRQLSNTGTASQYFFGIGHSQPITQRHEMRALQKQKQIVVIVLVGCVGVCLTMALTSLMMLWRVGGMLDRPL